LDEYHRAKTGALFAASAQLGAYAAGADGARWREFGDVVGRAYQAFDDVMDVIADSSITGKVGGRDVALARPSVVRADGGLVAARRRVAQLVDEAARVVPRCPSDRVVRAWLDGINARIDANLVSLDFGR
jgi:geranylgeranyl diphosphate synthase type II